MIEVDTASARIIAVSKSSFVNFAFVGRRESATSPTTVSCCLIGAKIYPPHFKNSSGPFWKIRGSFTESGMKTGSFAEKISPKILSVNGN